MRVALTGHRPQRLGLPDDETSDEWRYITSHKLYNSIKEQADEWIELSDEFYKGCDNVRDQYMVDHCDVLLAIWDGNKSGGVWSTIRKAQKAGKQIIYCPKEILSIE